MARHSLEVARPPVRQKRNRRGRSKYALAEAPDWNSDKPGLEAEVDESHFAHITADIVARARDIQPLMPTSPLAVSSGPEPRKSKLLSSSAGLLVYKGEAKASVIEAPPTQTSLQPHVVDEEDNQADKALDRLRAELGVLKAALVDRESALAKAVLDLEQARASWQRERRDAESKGGARLSEAEAERREQSATSLTEARAQAEAARNEADAELRRLHDNFATLRSTLADRESALAKAVLDHEQARASWQRESQDAERAWKVAEGARLAEAEVKWREQAAIALTDMRAQAEAARNEADAELRRLHDESAALRSALADRESALAKAVLDLEQARAGWQRESQDAERAWKVAEGARLAEAEVKWREQAAIALTDMRAQAEAARNEADAEFRRLHDKSAALRTTLADRESALAKAVLVHEEARERARQDLEAALAQAKAREAGEAQRLAAAEAGWRAQSQNALAEATARYQAAEGMLAQLRQQADRARSDAVGGSIRSGEPRATFATKPNPREVESAPIRLPTREERRLETQASKIIIQPQRMASEMDSRPPRKGSSFRDVIVVASIAVIAIFAYPRIEPFLPETWRSNIAAILGGLAPSPNPTAQGSASVVSDVNLRVEPSTTAEIITTLPRGPEGHDDRTTRRLDACSGRGQQRQRPSATRLGVRLLSDQ